MVPKTAAVQQLSNKSNSGSVDVLQAGVG